MTVHVDEAVLRDETAEGRCHVQDGPILPPATVRQLCCDGRPRWRTFPRLRSAEPAAHGLLRCGNMLREGRAGSERKEGHPLRSIGCLGTDGEGGAELDGPDGADEVRGDRESDEAFCHGDGRPDPTWMLQELTRQDLLRRARAIGLKLAGVIDSTGRWQASPPAGDSE